MKRKLKILYVIAAMGTGMLLEGVAIWLLWDSNESRVLLFIALTLHVAAMVPVTFAQMHYLPQLYHSQRRRVSLLLLSFNTIVPLLGIAVGWILMLWGFRKSQSVTLSIETENIDTEILTGRFPIIQRIFGEGSLSTLLSNPNVPSEKKIKALTMLTQIKSRASLSLIKETLTDPDDEVRLVGFSMLDKMEKRVNHKIHELKNIAKVHPDPHKRAEAFRELAFTYWELLYQGVVDTQLEQFVIDNLNHAIDEATQLIGDDPKLFKLQGRVALLQKRYAHAREAFVKALDLGISEREIASFMAQIAFEEHNYSRIGYWLEKVPAESINYQLYTLRSLWVVGEHAVEDAVEHVGEPV